MSAVPPDPSIKEPADLTRGRIIAKEILGYENPKIRNVSDQTLYELAAEPEICKTDSGVILDTKCAAHQYIAALSLSSLSAAIKNDIRTVMGVNISDANIEFFDEKTPKLFNTPYYLIFKYENNIFFVDYYNKKKTNTLKVGYYRVKGKTPEEIINLLNKNFGINPSSNIIKINSPTSFFDPKFLVFNYDSDKKEYFTEYYNSKEFDDFKVGYYRIQGSDPQEIIKLFSMTF
jgi:hypothetical protein